MDATPKNPWNYNTHIPTKTSNNTEIIDTSDFDIKKGYKESAGKLNVEYDWDFLEAQMKRMGKFKSKYAKYNWKKPISIDDLKDSLFRHTLSVMKGNYTDDNVELDELPAIALNAMLIYYQLKTIK